jgi:hypothetical protein
MPSAQNNSNAKVAYFRVIYFYLKEKKELMNTWLCGI